MTLNKNRKRKPFWAWVLIILLIFQSISALFGGIALIVEPSGSLLKMPVVSLENSPFSSFLLPGIVLTVLLGIFPAFTAYCLIFRPAKKGFNFLNLYADRHCGWAYSLYIGLMLMIWITVQVAIVGYGHIIQTVYASIGIILTILTLIPSVMRYYIKEETPEKKEWRTL
jgi:hypothetical protein